MTEVMESSSFDTVTPVELALDNDDTERLGSDEIPPEADSHLLPVVGLGGSAGSIAALQQFFKDIPTDLGMAYVVVVHLSPDYESALTQILQTRTSMPVMQVTGTQVLEADHVYVIPPGHHLAMDDGKIRLTEPDQSRGKRVAVDLFFRTLATSHRSKAVAIVLSGTDGDGAIGIKRIKEHGGVTVAQDPDEAEYDGMPRSAIDTGMVDWILSIDQMTSKLAEFIHNEKRIQLPPVEVPAQSGDPALFNRKSADESALREVLAFLQSRTGHDFSHYKRATVLRRVGRRLQVNSLESIPQYANFLRTHPGETGALLQDLLISVTNFFRDPEAFRALDFHLARLFRDKHMGTTVRVWVPGCATGEEAYSLAMLLLEHAEKMESPPEVQIFATDLDENALRIAREGLYPSTIVADVSPERLRRFFTVDNKRFRVRKELRERVLFASHNLLKDSPFSRLDLVSCRNLLIYFTREAQDRVFQLFHFALRPGGLLFLGGSETAEDSLVFTPQDKKQRLYERTVAARPQIPFPVFATPPLPIPPVLPLGTQPHRTSQTEIRREEGPTLSFGELHLKLLEQSSPPSILVNHNYDIVHLSEEAGKYLRLGGGESSLNLLNVIHPSLRLELRAALFRASQSGEDVDVPATSFELDGFTRHVAARVRPLRDTNRPKEERPDGSSNFVLIIFDEPTHVLPSSATPSPAPDAIAQRLEAELEYLKSYLRASIEQYDASAEELKASNEELQAMNEEQRSASEELETSREEIQAANEELLTLNQELKGKIEELSRSNSDLQNLMASTNIATVFLDRNLRIKRYTPSAVDLFSFIATDIGRPLVDLRHRLGEERFINDASQVLRTLETSEREVRTEDARWFLLRTSPYRALEDRIDGVVLSFIDITERKNAEDALRESEARFRAIVSQATAGIAMTDLKGRFLMVNDEFCQLSGHSSAELLNMQLQEILHLEEAPPDRGNFHRMVTEGISFEVEKRFTRKDGSQVGILASVAPVRDAQGKTQSVCAVVVDISELQKAQESLLHSEDRLRNANEELEERVMTRTQNLEEEIERRKQWEMERTHLMHRVVQVQEDERKRISRELHDNLGQHLTAMMLSLQIVQNKEKLPQGERRSNSEQLEKLHSQMEELLDTTHRLAWELRPAVLDNVGLEAALQQYVNDWNRPGLSADFVSRLQGDNTSLSTEAETALYRLVQEALNNVLRHAQATQVSVVLERNHDFVTVIVEDNGQGFDSGDSQQTDRLGLLGMQERMELIGGSLEIESSPGAGATVYARAPLNEVEPVA